MTAMPFGLRGSGIALPRRAVPSTEVDALVGQASGWTEANFAIATRYWTTGDETTSSLGAAAASAALVDAGWVPEDLNVIIDACGVMEQPIPGTAPSISEANRMLSIGITLVSNSMPGK